MSKTSSFFNFQNSYRGNCHLIVDTRSGRSLYETFVKVHRVVGNGPTPFIAKKAMLYFLIRGYMLGYSNVSNLKKSINDNTPVAVYVSKSLSNWHWVIYIGYREYSNGKFYCR